MRTGFEKVVQRAYTYKTIQLIDITSREAVVKVLTYHMGEDEKADYTYEEIREMAKMVDEMDG